ncbi:MAG: type II 3-dehydroquinate dehydratase [Sphingomonadales bacterium]
MTPSIKRSVLILNGPNLNMLGLREPSVYGRATLADIEKSVRERAAELQIAVDFWQSNNEGELVAWIHEARGRYHGIIINAGAYSHSSIALLDALKLVDIPVIEVHISNIFRREDFRHHSYISQAANGVICGLGTNGYRMALEAVHQITQDT